MKAVICTKFGAPEVLEIKEIEKPVPKDNEVLVKIRAATVTAGDVKERSREFGLGFVMSVLYWLPLGLILGFTKPKRSIPGMELSGEVESVGKDVTLFKKGDKVFGTTTGLSKGSYAQYICIPEIPSSKKSLLGNNVLAIKPSNMSFEEAAAIPVGAITALALLKKGNIKKGQKVLVYGASGSVGTYAVQLAKYFGAAVTGVCSSANLKLIKSLGADTVIDYTKEDFSQRPDRYDIILDAVGKIKKSTAIKLLALNGSFRHIMETTEELSEEFIFLKELVEAGKIKPVIDKKYSLEQVVEAHRYVDQRHKKGNVTITIG